MSRVENNSLARSWWDVWHGMSDAVVSGGGDVSAEGVGMGL